MALFALNFLHNVRKIKHVVCVLLMLACVAACSNNESVPVDNAWRDIGSTQTMHKVQPGETIYTIAWRYGVSYQDLAAWNHLSSPYYLSIGQNLRVVGSPVKTQAATSSLSGAPAAETIPSTPTFTPVESSTPQKTAASPLAKSASPVAVGQGSWPWPVKGKVIESYGENGNKGLDIGVPSGTDVKAVQDGSVVYAGNNLRGYGQLIIIKQKEDVMTAYAHNSQLLVKVNQPIKMGQTIAKSGNTDASQAMLHFEVRKAGKPVDPMQYLSK